MTNWQEYALGGFFDHASERNKAYAVLLPVQAAWRNVKDFYGSPCICCAACPCFTRGEIAKAIELEVAHRHGDDTCLCTFFMCTRLESPESHPKAASAPVSNSPIVYYLWFVRVKVP